MTEHLFVIELLKGVRTYKYLGENKIDDVKDSNLLEMPAKLNSGHISYMSNLMHDQHKIRGKLLKLMTEYAVCELNSWQICEFIKGSVEIIGLPKLGYQAIHRIDKSIEVELKGTELTILSVLPEEKRFIGKSKDGTYLILNFDGNLYVCEIQTDEDIMSWCSKTGSAHGEIKNIIAFKLGTEKIGRLSGTKIWVDDARPKMKSDE